VDVAFSIQKIPLTICPDANQQKNEGEADPARFTFTSIGLLDGDVVSGILKREPGEEAGNYNFVLTGLSAADYYTLRLMDDAPQCFRADAQQHLVRLFGPRQRGGEGAPGVTP